MVSSMHSTLVIAPHADDEVLGCASALDTSCHVYYVGIDEHHRVDRATRLKEVAAVSAYFGFTFTVGDFPVNRYYERHVDLVQALETVIDSLSPKRVLIPLPSYNQDHKTVYDASLTALRHHDELCFVPQVLIYEAPDNFQWPVHVFQPTFFAQVDIEKKLNGYRLHASQVRAHRSMDLLRVMAATRGAQAKLPAAEAFAVLRWVET